MCIAIGGYPTCQSYPNCSSTLSLEQLLDCLTAAKLLPELQLTYQAYHSLETGVVKVLTDVLPVLDTSDITVLMLLELSAAFETVDHATLL